MHSTISEITTITMSGIIVRLITTLYLIAMATLRIPTTIHRILTTTILPRTTMNMIRMMNMSSRMLSQISNTTMNS